MNGKTVFDWTKVLPLLKDNYVIVMDNVPYHSVKTGLVSKGKLEKKIKNLNNLARLMEMLKRIKPIYNKYVKEHNKIILRLLSL